MHRCFIGDWKDTALAATAAQVEKNVFYFYCGLVVDAENIQKFYQPHADLTEALHKVLGDFEKDMGGAKFGQKLLGVDTLSRKASGKGGTLFSLLSKVFFSKVNLSSSFDDLKQKIGAMDPSPLVFIDEAPDEHSQGFNTTILLRNVLRAFNIAPIVMSTHTGAMNALNLTGDSRGGRENIWCRLFVKLPPYIAADDKVYTDNPCLSKTERPWIAKMMVDDIPEKTSLTKIVVAVQETIQKHKPMAWECPALQLYQLFRCKKSGSASTLAQMATMHRVVGSHFGHIEADNDVLNVEFAGAQKLLNVRFVEPEKEPVLFLALTSWTANQLSSMTRPHFPLFYKGMPLTIMKAFSLSGQLFSSPVSVANPAAVKPNGDDLEVLALAAVTLASLQHDGLIFQRTPLPRYLAALACLMQRSTEFSDRAIDNMKASIEALLPDEFSTRTVPPCPCVESRFDAEGQQQVQGGTFGGVKRPRDGDMRDGELDDCTGGPVLHLECKNYQDGVTKTVFEAVVSRTRLNYHVAICFVSRLNQIFTEDGSWEAFTNDLLLKSASELCVLIIPQETSPQWLKVERGQVELKYVKEETKYLLVVIVCGVVAPI